MFRLKKSRQPRPVFIIGSYRSGTSALTWALGQHPNLFPLEETHFLYKLSVDLEFLHELGTAQGLHSFLGLAKYTQEQFHQYFGHASHRLVLEARKRIEQNSYEAARVDRTHISANVKMKAGWRRPKRRWVDGTPENSHFVLPLLRMLPEAKFIHVLRNPRRVAVSLMHFASAGGRDYPEQEAYETWMRLARDAALSEQALGQDKVMRLLHEDLLVSPRDAVVRCMACIGEKYHADCLMPLKEKLNSSLYDDSADCRIEANIDSPSPWIREAFELYQQLLNGTPMVEGGATGARAALEKSLNVYAESLRPDVNERLTQVNLALKAERKSLWQRLSRHEVPFNVLDWGPKDIVAGVSFNEQQDGSSALWISTQSAPENTVVHLAGNALATAVSADGKLVTAIVPSELTSHPGHLALHLKSPWSDQASVVVDVEIFQSVTNTSADMVEPDDTSLTRADADGHWLHEPMRIEADGTR